MLVTDGPFTLVGSLSATDDAPGFVVPIFGRAGSNITYVQHVGADGRIAGFREAVPSRAWQPFPSVVELEPGAPALWGFRDDNGGLVIAERDTLVRQLKTMLVRLHDPFLHLQVVQFCDDTEALTGAWQRGYDHLATKSRRSARAWRDVVVIPSQFRSTIERAVRQYGLGAQLTDFDRAVHVEVDARQLKLYLNTGLYGAVQGDPRLRAAVEKGAAPLRRAFGLSAAPVELLDGGEESAFDPRGALHPTATVVALGRMAARVALACASHRAQSNFTDAYGDIAAIDSNSSLIVKDDAVAIHRLVGSLDEPSVLGTGEPVFIVFQLSDQHPRLFRAALDLAGSRSRQQRTAIAVIPHFPRQFGQPGDLEHEILPQLNDAFDAVWVLSDRSPYARQALWYGPGHSVQAAAANLKYLLGLDRAHEPDHKRLSGPHGAATVNVVAKATGDRTAGKLTEHAMMRLACDLFDLTTAKAAHIGAGYYGSPDNDAVKRAIGHAAPKARTTYDAEARHYPGYAEVQVALRGVRVVDKGPRGFEQYCLAQLDGRGWSVDQFGPNGMIHVSKGKLENLGVEFDYVAGTPLEYQVRPASRSASDLAILTNANLTRQSFTAQVLRGAAPVHYSRVESLDRIWRRRFAYALSYLLKERENSVTVLTSAALDWLMQHQSINRKNVRKIALADQLVPDVSFTADDIWLTLPLTIIRGRAPTCDPVSGHAQLHLDLAGWHLVSLFIDGRSVRF